MHKIKYQVFLSSTYSDLSNERKQVLDVLLMADCIPAGMESFVATDDEQFAVIKKVIDLCDYYILIIGKRYGTVNESSGLSYTEMEYDYAIENGIPVLVFVLDDKVKLDDDKIEKDDIKRGKLAEFRVKALKNRLASVWRDSADLMTKVAVSIMQAKFEIKRPGWHRGTPYNSIGTQCGIAEEVKGLDCIPDDYEWNYSKPLFVLHTHTHHTNLRLIKPDLRKFKQVDIVFALSKQVAVSRSIARSDGLVDFYDRGITKTLLLLNDLNKYNCENINIFLADKNQFPFGIMLFNEKHVFFSPLWNHYNDPSGAIGDVCLKISSNSRTADLIIASFEYLRESGTKIEKDKSNKFNINYFKYLVEDS